MPRSRPDKSPSRGKHRHGGRRGDRRRAAAVRYRANHHAGGSRRFSHERRGAHAFLRREPVGPALYNFRSASVDDYEGLLGQLLPASRSCEFLERCGSRPQPGRLDHRNVGKRYRVRKRPTTAPTIPASSSATATGCEDDWFRGDSRQTASRFGAKSVDFFRR